MVIVEKQRQGGEEERRDEYDDEGKRDRQMERGTESHKALGPIPLALAYLCMGHVFVHLQKHRWGRRGQDTLRRDLLQQVWTKWWCVLSRETLFVLFIKILNL